VPLRLIGYHRSFRHLRTHVLLERPVSGDAARDVPAVYAALRAGHCYLAVDSVAPARGFRFAGMGEVVSAPFAVSAHVPRPALLRLLCDGRLLMETHGVGLDVVAEEPGAYRVEALLPAYGRQRMWIISNPVYVR
jgi:hypothetical protein